MLMLIYRLSLMLIALLLAAVASVSVMTGIQVLQAPEASAFSQAEAVGLCGFAAVALGSMFLIYRSLKRTYDSGDAE